jgi:hypothetical protein
MIDEGGNGKDEARSSITEMCISVQVYEETTILEEGQ